jgi:FkbM family methyltransferase
LQRISVPGAIIVPGGVKMHLDPLEWSQMQLLEGRVVEPETIRLMKKLLKRDDVYVDIGAHVGYHSLIARTVSGETGRVIAVEPQPYNCARLLANWRANNFDNLFLFAGLAGSRDEFLVTVAQQKEIDTTRLSLVLDPIYDEARTFGVSMVKLERLLDTLNVKKIGLLKVDVEGMERDVIFGMGSYLRQTENIIIEFLSNRGLDQSYIELFEHLRAAGFATLTLFGDEWEYGMLLPENNLWIRKLPRA